MARESRDRRSPVGRPGRVCLLTSSHPVDYSRFYHREAASLARAGYEVTLVGLDASGPLPPIGVKTVGLRVRRHARKQALLLELAALARAEQADVYHCLDPWSLAIGLWLKRNRPDVGLVYDSTESFPDAFKDRFELPQVVRSLGYTVIRFLEHRAAAVADAVIETNQTRAGRFERLGVRPALVSNYPPLELVPESSTARKQWVVYTGLISRRRGFDRLVHACTEVLAGFPSARLKVIGQFDPGEDIESWTRKYLERSAIAGRVDLLGTLAYEAMFQVLSESLLGVILFQPERRNDYTGLPNKLFEFMASGMAVVASDFPEMNRVVRASGCGWLVDPTDTEGMAQVLVSALGSPARCIELGCRGRKAVLERYNWTLAETALLELYRRILG